MKTYKITYLNLDTNEVKKWTVKARSETSALNKFMYYAQPLIAKNVTITLV